MSNQSEFSQLNDEAWLRRRYIAERQPATEIARELGCHRESVARALRRFGIATVRRGKAEYPQLANHEWLVKEVQDKPLRLIASEVGCSYSAVVAAVKRCKIEIPHRGRYRMSVNKSEAVKAGLRKRYPNGRRGAETTNWRGGRIKRGNYWWLHRDLVAERWPDHPRLMLDDWSHKQEHILVTEAHVGRVLEPGEDVHHGPGGKEDNRIKNLTLTASRADHISRHWANARETEKARVEIERLREENEYLRVLLENERLRALLLAHNIDSDADLHPEEP